jgi:hypothetical protein
MACRLRGGATVAACLDKPIGGPINDAQDIENDGGFGYPVWQMEPVDCRQHTAVSGVAWISRDTGQ